MKKLWMIFLTCISFVCIAFATSCDKTELAFNEGYLEEVVLGEPIMLDEYIDPALTDDYTAILTCDETGQERDLKELVQWTTDKPGTYTLTYTVKSGKNKGTISAKIEVVVSKATWKYSTPTLNYRAGDTMSMNVFKRQLNIAVNSYYDYEFYVDKVRHNGQTESLRDKASYTFPDMGDFTFTFCVETQDGQFLSAEHTINVRKEQILAEGAEDWMAENNISVDADGYTYISPEGYVELDAGYINGSYFKDYVPYLAFNGEEGSKGYGENTYVTVDFTGKNLPQVAFFCDEVKPSYCDGGKGILFFNGFAYGRTNVEPQISRMVIFGPNKASYGELDNKGRFVAIGSATDPCPASWNSLDENCQYRYIIGIEDAKATSMTARILLINLTTSERVWDFTQKLSGYTVTQCSLNPCPHTSGGCSEPLNLDDSYYTGSIVLYGMYGHNATFDKVYMPVTGVKDIYELDQAAEFKDNYKKNYKLGDTANVADYITIPATDYEFRVTASDGVPVAIDADGNFTYTKSGAYRLYYAPSDTTIRPSSITVRVMYDLENPFAEDYFETQGVINPFEGSILAVPNTNTNFVAEGQKSIKYYAVNATDRLLWVGDLAPEVMALTSIYGRLSVVERSLDLAKKLAPSPKFMNDIYTYSMWWIIILADYYKEFACKEYVKKHIRYLVELLDLLDGLVDEKGDLNREIRYLVDWPTKDSVDELVGVRVIFLMAINGAAYLLKAFGLSTDKAVRIKEKLLKSDLIVLEKKQVIALKYFATGQLTDEEYNKLIDGGVKGFSTFMSYYILSAIASRDEKLAIELMKEYYGAMLDRGATTFWEDFNMDWLEGSGRIDEFDDTKKDLHGDYGAHC